MDLFLCVFFSNHASEQNIDFVFTITEITTLDEMVGLLTPSTGWCVQFEGPQEVGNVLEICANSEDFMNQIFDTLCVSATAQFPFNVEIVGDWHTLSLVLQRGKKLNYKFGKNRISI